MSEPVTRRKILTDYRIRATQCELCGRIYFPPKLFCNVEGRGSRMVFRDYFNSKGTFSTGAVVRRPTNRFEYMGSFLAGFISLHDGPRVPGRITDYVPPEEEVNVDQFIDREVVPRFRKAYEDGPHGIIYYSSQNFSFTDDYYPYQEYQKVKPSGERGRPGIVGYGVYIPKFRIENKDADESHGVKERTVPFADEDTTTFAVEAAKRALIHAGLDGRYVKKCYLGSESAPYAVKPSMATVSQVLQLGEEYDDGFISGGVDTQFACKAASDLFIDAAALVAFPSFRGENVMVIGADNSQAARDDPLDFTVGAGGAAFIFGERDVIATLDHYLPYTSDTPDFYRRDGAKYPRHGGRFTGKPAYFKHVVTAMKLIMEEATLKPKDFDYVVCHSPNARFPLQAALEAGFEPNQAKAGLLVQWIGNLYSGSSPAALAAVLDEAKPGNRILMTSYGSGAGSDAYIFTVTEAIEEKRHRCLAARSQVENPHRQYVDYHTYRQWKEMS